MCLGVAGRIIEAPDAAGTAGVAVGGRARDVSCVVLLDDGPVEVGQWVLIHMGVAIARLDETEARDVLGAAEEAGPPVPESGRA